MAPAKTHIMRWAPQDWRTSTIRMASVLDGDPLLRLVYLEALFALWEAGGTLPADPLRLSLHLALDAGVVGEKLPKLVSLGAVTDNGDGTISNPRVLSDLSVELEFRQQQAAQGRRGGRAKAKARASHRQATAKPSPSDGQANGQPSVSPPAPAPAPSNGVNQATSAREKLVPPVGPRVVVVNGLTGMPQEWDGGPWFPTREARQAAESEALRLAQEAGRGHGTDPPDEMARAASYPGARLRKINPATMSHDRLVNTLAALRERCGLAAPADEPFDAFKRAGLA